MRVILRLFASCLMLVALWCAGMGAHGAPFGAAMAAQAGTQTGTMHAASMQAARPQTAQAPADRAGA